MAWAWYGKMKLVAGIGKYQPYWTNPCGGADVEGKMEAAANGKYKPLPDAFGVCTAEELANLSRYMYLDETSGKYKPHVVLNSEEMCCAGTECDGCDGYIWPAGETPKQVTATIVGITECSGLCSSDFQSFNGTWTLTQLDNYPCIWYYSDYESSPKKFIRWMTYYDVPPKSWLHIWTVDSMNNIEAYYGNSQENFCAVNFGDSTPPYSGGFHPDQCCQGPVNWGLNEGNGEIVAHNGYIAISWPV